MGLGEMGLGEMRLREMLPNQAYRKCTVLKIFCAMQCSLM